MWSWFIYKIQSVTVADAIDRIDRDAERMRYKHQIHTYSHDIVSVLHYRHNAADRLSPIGYKDNYYWQKSEFWAHKIQTETDIIDIVFRRRSDYLFNPILSRFWARNNNDESQPELAKFDRQVDRLKESYANVDERDRERQFLAEGERQLYPLFLQCQHLNSAYFSSQAAEWHHITRSWRWLKRNTSISSFPFVRPGLDIIKTLDAIDLGGDVGKTWYAIVRFHF